MKVNLMLCLAILTKFLHKANAGMCLDESWVKYLDIKCYKLISQLQTWQAGVRACRAESTAGIIGTIKSIEEQSFLVDFLSATENSNNVWLGAKRQNESTFAWPGGASVVYANWSDGSPTTLQLGLDCVEIALKSAAGGPWKDVECTKQNYVLCEVPQTLETPANTPGTEITPGEDVTELRQIISDMKKDLDATRYNLTVLLQELMDTRKEINAGQTEITNLTQISGGGTNGNGYALPTTEDVAELGQIISDMKKELDINRYNLTVLLQELTQAKMNMNASQLGRSSMKQSSSAGKCLDNSWVKYADTKCYKVIKELKTWEDGSAACQADSDVTMGTIQSSDEQTFVMDYLSGIVNNIWIGATKQGDSFVWLGGEIVLYGNWEGGSSPPYVEGHDCVEIESQTSKSGGYWKDVLCTNLNYVLCESPLFEDTATENPVPPANENITELQKMLLEMKKDLDITRYNLTVVLKELMQTKRDIDAAQKAILNIKQTSGGGKSGTCLDNTWVKFSDTKCYKMIKQVQTWQEGMRSCRADSAEASIGSIKGSDEQAFLINYLFTSTGNVNNVWLGATREDNSYFVWQGGEEVKYTSWGNGYPSEAGGQDCVEMESLVSASAGQWKNTMCTSLNYVLCELPQLGGVAPPPTTTTTPRPPPSGDASELQRAIWELRRDFDLTRFNLTLMMQELSQIRRDVNSAKTDIASIKQNPGGGGEIGQKLSAAQQEIFQARRDIISTQNDIATLKRNTGVPIGFVYTEIPGQSSPKTIWPSYTWTDISSTHAGMFFRILGGKAACFGCSQSGTSPRISSITTSGTKDCGKWSYNNVLTLGTTSKFVRTGGNSGHSIGIQFTTSNDEVRPINKAVRLWKRTA